LTNQRRGAKRSEKKKPKNKKPETIFFKKKLIRKSCVNMGKTNKSINYFDLYKGIS
jgi:hypothetical protein